jgi:cell wall-associated NlpC family hydrolase
MTLWASRYVGAPFLDRGRCLNGLDCWGLVRMVLTERAGLDLPLYDGICALDGRTIRDVVRSDTQSGEWLPVMAGQGREMDVVLMRGRVEHEGRVTSAETHVGVLVSPSQVLHVEVGVNAIIERLDSPRIASRVTRLFRHRSLA